MIWKVALLGLVASASANIPNPFNLWPKSGIGFRVRFGLNPVELIQNKLFMEQPQSRAAAEEKEWQVVTRPTIQEHEGFSSLEMLCPKGFYNFCVFFDNTGYVAGEQIAFETNRFTDAVYDWKTQGFTNWTINNADGTTEHYVASQIFFSSPEFLKTSAADRIAARDPNKLLQDSEIQVSGIDGKLHAIPTNAAEIANTAKSNFTQQACIPLMGKHYYYKMTEQLECSAKLLFPFFPLVCKGQLVGIGFVAFGKYTPKDGSVNYCEEPPRLVVEGIVPRGPECLYQLADSPGLVTIHTYFINNPVDLLCPCD